LTRADVNPPRSTPFRPAFPLAVVASLTAPAAELDPSKLPPPASREVSFAADIQPLLERSCLRCHGPERPKSGFRLDNAESALKGPTSAPT
jgi:hypothetical protein